MLFRRAEKGNRKTIVATAYARTGPSSTILEQLPPVGNPFMFVSPFTLSQIVSQMRDAKQFDTRMKTWSADHPFAHPRPARTVPT